jgi:hypothetical protein
MEKKTKEAYLPPRVTVRQVMQEGAMADAITSYRPTVKANEVEYTDFEDSGEVEGNVAIF